MKAQPAGRSGSFFDEHASPAGPGPHAVRGGAIAIAARASSAAIQIGALVLLARLLSPDDYGLVAMVIALTGFASVFVDLGTRDALVRRARVTAGEASALFWITVAVGCACTLVLSICGPLIASFYGDPRLTTIALVSSFTFLAAALVSHHQALLQRSLMFRELAIVDIVATLLSASLAIGMASLGFGYWALVVRPVALYSLVAIGVWLFCGWWPVRPTLTPGVREMLRFGLNLTGFAMIDYAGRNVDRVAVGKSLGALTLGFYQNSLLIYDQLMGVLVMPLHPVAVAGLSKLQDDLAQLRRSWARALSTVAFFAMPAFGLFAIVSQDAVVLLLGSPWATSGVLLSVLALRGIPHSVERTSGWLHVAAGRTDRWLRTGIVVSCGQVLALLIGLPFGITGIVCAYVLFMYLAFIPTLAYAGQPLGIGALDVLNVVGAQVSGALAAASLGFALRVWLLTDVTSIERIAILAAAYVLTYLCVVIGLFRVTTPLLVGLSLVGNFLPGALKPWADRRLARPRA